MTQTKALRLPLLLAALALLLTLLGVATQADAASYVFQLSIRPPGSGANLDCVTPPYEYAKVTVTNVDSSAGEVYGVWTDSGGTVQTGTRVIQPGASTNFILSSWYDITTFTLWDTDNPSYPANNFRGTVAQDYCHY